jgi:hypothetical protein
VPQEVVAAVHDVVASTAQSPAARGDSSSSEPSTSGSSAGGGGVAGEGVAEELVEVERTISVRADQHPALAALYRLQMVRAGAPTGPALLPHPWRGTAIRAWRGPADACPPCSLARGPHPPSLLPTRAGQGQHQRGPPAVVPAGAAAAADCALGGGGASPHTRPLHQQLCSGCCSPVSKRPLRRSSVHVSRPPRVCPPTAPPPPDALPRCDPHLGSRVDHRPPV